MQTRKFPRTLNEAFGPYTSQEIHDPNDSAPDYRDVAVVVACALAVFFLAMMALAGWLK